MNSFNRFSGFKTFPRLKVEFVILIALFVTIATPGYAQYTWTKLALPDTLPVIAVAGDANYIFASTNQKLFRSGDKGANWALIDSSTPHVNQTDFVTMVFSNNTLVVGVRANGTRISTDFGATWPRIFTGGSQVVDLAKDEDNIFFCSRGKGLFRSTDNGINWKLVYTKDEPVCVAANGDLVVLSNWGGDHPLQYSIDKGESWNPASIGGMRALAFKGNKIISAEKLNSVYTSEDQFKTWTKTNTDNFNLRVYSLLVKDDYIFAATQSGVYLSSNQGVNWTAINNGLPEIMINSLAMCGTQLLAGTKSGLYICDFSNSQQVDLNTPQGGQSFSGNTKVDISWNSTGINNLKIEFGYLNDNQEFVWQIIDPSYPAIRGRYFWKAPGINTSQARIRISSASNASLTDETPMPGFSINIDNSIPELKFIETAAGVCPGSTITMEPAVIGDTTGRQLTYKWTKNFNDIGSDPRITGIFAGRLAIDYLTGADSGAYVLEAAVTPGNYTLVSEPFGLGILNPPVIRKLNQKDYTINQGTQFLAGLEVYGSEELSYQWYKDNSILDNQTTDTLIIANAQPADAGVYFCAVTHACGISYSDTLQLTIMPTSVDQDTYYGHLAVSHAPNPANGQIVISVECLTPGEAEINLYDIFGDKVSTVCPGFRAETSFNVSLSVSGLPPGTYYYVLKSGASQAINKLIIAR